MHANDAWAMTPVAFIDDDDTKLMRRMLGVAVRGGGEDVSAIIARYGVNEIVISSPSIGPDVEARLRAACAERNVKVRRLSLEIK